MSRLASAAAAVAQPVLWSALGYQFEAASMIAGLSACLMVRIWVSLKDRASHALALDLTDAQGNTTTYEYDGIDRLLKTRYPVTTAGSGTSSTTDYEQLGYDAASNVTSRRVRDGQVLYYTYDALNRRTYDDNPGTNAAEADVSYTYDNLGRLTQGLDANGWYSAYQYDALSRVQAETSNLSANTYQYDAAGRMTWQHWADGFYVNYDRLVTGEVSAIRENGATSGVGVLATYGYDDLGRRTGITRGNGTTTSYGYDAVSRLTSLSHDVSGTTYDIAYGYSYNPAGQITSRSSSNDAYARVGSANRNDASAVNGLNQATSAGTASLSYDARGNLTNDGGSTTYTYNTRNELYTYGGGTLLYRGPNGLLGQLLLPVGGANLDNTHGDLATEFDGSNGAILRRYVFDPDSDQPLVWYEGSGTSDRRWLHDDERGSVVATSNASGSVTAVNTYDEYGVPGSGNVGRFQYTGQKWIPQLGLYDYKARMYHPRLGRFMQTDPIGYADGMNWYVYVGGDPINAIDPSGLATGTLPKCIPSIEDICVNGPPKVDTESGGLPLPGLSLGPVDGPDIIVNGSRPPKAKKSEGDLPQSNQALCPPGMASKGRDASGQLQCVAATPPSPPPPPVKPNPYWRVGCSWLADGAGAVVGGIAGTAVTALAVETGPAAPFIGGAAGFVVGGGVNRTFSNSFCPK